MKTITLQILENVELDARQLARFLAAKLYERGQLTQGQAAEWPDSPRWLLRRFSLILRSLFLTIRRVK